MANNLRYLLEHFCLDGQTIDISSQLDEENADKIEKLNNETVPNIEKDLETAQGKIITLEETVAPLSQKVDDNVTNIEGLTNSITDLTNNVIPSIKNNVTDLQTKTSDLESDLTELRGVTVNGISKKVEDLTTKVGTNTDDINAINTTSIPHLQGQIDDLKIPLSWKLLATKETTHDGLKLTIKIYSNGASYYAYLIYDFKNVTDIKLNVGYNFDVDIPLPTADYAYFYGNTYFFVNEVGFSSLLKLSTGVVNITLVLKSKPTFSSLLSTITSGIFYF